MVSTQTAAVNALTEIAIQEAMGSAAKVQSK